MVIRYWTAAATHFYEEERAAHNIERQGFQFYLPRILVKRKSSLRREFLFPGYIFVKISEGWQSIMHTRGVRRMFFCNGVPTRMRDTDITGIKSREGADGCILLEPPVTAGTEVRVCAGTFENMLGVVQGMSPRERCMVLLNVMDRAVSVSMPLAHVRPI